MIDYDWLKSKNACYYDATLRELFPCPRTIQEVLTLNDGPWADIPFKDRVWVVSRFLSQERLRLILCHFAAKSFGETTPKVFLDGVAYAKMHAEGKVDNSLLEIHYRAMCDHIWRMASAEYRMASETCYRDVQVAFVVEFGYPCSDGSYVSGLTTQDFISEVLKYD